MPLAGTQVRTKHVAQFWPMRLEGKSARAFGKEVLTEVRWKKVAPSPGLSDIWMCRHSNHQSL